MIDQRDAAADAPAIASHQPGSDELAGEVATQPAHDVPANVIRYPNPRGFDRRDQLALCPGSLLYALENNQIETDADYYWEDPVTGQWQGGYDPKHGASAGDRPSRGR